MSRGIIDGYRSASLWRAFEFTRRARYACNRALPRETLKQSPPRLTAHGGVPCGISLSKATAYHQRTSGTDRNAPCETPGKGDVRRVFCLRCAIDERVRRTIEWRRGSAGKRFETD